MTTAVYVLSEPSNGNPNRYKIGSHTGELNKLISRYITSLPDLVVHYFIELNNAKEIERIFKTNFENKRINNRNGNKCEWVIMSIDEIITGLSLIIFKNKIVMNNDTRIINFKNNNPPETPPIINDESESVFNVRDENVEFDPRISNPKPEINPMLIKDSSIFQKPYRIVGDLSVIDFLLRKKLYSVNNCDHVENIGEKYIDYQRVKASKLFWISQNEEETLLKSI